jgi:hypothetical protein
MAKVLFQEYNLFEEAFRTLAGAASSAFSALGR